MASSTYHQLPETKRKRILEALMDEFSQVTYSEASINRVIKQAQISRGSFYQYFENKEDAYLEVLDVIAKRKLAIFEAIEQADIDPSHNVFDHALELIQKIAVWMEREPRLHRIGVLMDLDRSDFIEKLKQRNPGLDRYFEDLIYSEQQQGKIDAHVDARLLSEMITLVSQHFLRKHFDDQRYDEMIQQARTLYQILKKGTEGERHV